jgi:hypothetical protein
MLDDETKKKVSGGKRKRGMDSDLKEINSSPKRTITTTTTTTTTTATTPTPQEKTLRKKEATEKEAEVIEGEMLQEDNVEDAKGDNERVEEAQAQD